MTNLEMFTNAIKSMEGLEVSLKVGKESEFTVKGDFMKIAGAIGTVLDSEEKKDIIREDINSTEKEIMNLREQMKKENYELEEKLRKLNNKLRGKGIEAE